MEEGTAIADDEGIGERCMPHQAHRLNGAVPLFQALTEREISQILDLARLQTVRAKMDIIRQERANGAIYCLLRGSVRIYLRRDDCREIVLNILGPHSILGDISALDGRPASAGVKTMEECRPLVVPGGMFRSFLKEMPQLALNHIAMQNHRMRQLTAQSEALAVLEIDARIARQLVLFAAEYGVMGSGKQSGSSAGMAFGKREASARLKETGVIRLPLRLTQSDIAALCRASRKQVNRVLAEYQDQGLIAVERGHRITLLCLEKLRNRCPASLCESPGNDARSAFCAHW